MVGELNTVQNGWKTLTSKLDVRRRVNAVLAAGAGAGNVGRPAAERQQPQLGRQRAAVVGKRPANGRNVVVGLKHQQGTKNAVQHRLTQAVGAVPPPCGRSGNTARSMHGIQLEKQASTSEALR